jgi:hypothetical protein
MIEVVQGDDTSIVLTLKKASGSVYDLTDCTIFATVKRDSQDADSSALISTILVSAAPTNGQATWNITDLETKYMSGLYKYDIQMVNNIGNVSTLQRGDFLVTQDVTKRIV